MEPNVFREIGTLYYVICKFNIRQIYTIQLWAAIQSPPDLALISKKIQVFPKSLKSRIEKTLLVRKELEENELGGLLIHSAIPFAKVFIARVGYGLETGGIVPNHIPDKK